MSLFVCFWSIINLQHYVSSCYTTQWFNISIRFKVIPMISRYDNNVRFLNVANYRHFGEDSIYFNSWTYTKQLKFKWPSKGNYWEGLCFQMYSKPWVTPTYSFHQHQNRCLSLLFFTLYTVSLANSTYFITLIQSQISTDALTNRITLMSVFTAI